MRPKKVGRRLGLTHPMVRGHRLRLGIAAWLLFFAVVTWTIIDLGLLRIAGSGTVATIVLVNLANLLAVGVSWSYVRARLSGQADTNNVTLP